MPPPKAQAALQRALQDHQAGRIAAAAAGYAEARRMAPQLFEPHHLGGAAALQLGRLEEALALLQKAAQLRPQSGPTQMCLGMALGQLGRPAEAEKALRLSTKLDAKNHEAWSNLGSILVVLGRLDEAAACYEQAIKLQPKFAQAWTALGSVLQLQTKSAAALERHTKALQLDPAHPKAQCCRGQSLQSLHRVDEALADFEGHLARQPDDFEAASCRLFLLNYSAEITRERLFAEHREFGRRIAEKFPASPTNKFPQPLDPEKRLRVAILSPDFRQHSVAYFIEPLIQHLDTGAFELALYHDHFVVDQTSQRLAKHAKIWRNFVGQPNATVEAQIRADRPDILIELAGHTGMNRLPALARRLAPIQASYLGYPNTTGLTTIDYRFTDAVVDPPGESDAMHTEKLVRFSQTAWTYTPPAEAPEVSTATADRPLTFGSFNALSKVNRFTLELWAETLRAVPGSRLLIKGVSAESLPARAADAGIPADRLLTLPHAASVGAHLAQYAQVDIALDPFPYHGTTTTCEALWMGVPVISLAGDRHASRVGASLLTAIGHADWIAHSRAEYAAIARRLAGDRAALAQIRAGLRDDLRRSPLLDHPGQAARFGEALRKMWRDHCSAAGASSALSTTAR